MAAMILVLLAVAVLLRRPIILLEASSEADGVHGGVRGEGSARSVLPLLDARWGMTYSPLLGFDSGSSVSMPARVDALLGCLLSDPELATVALALLCFRRTTAGEPVEEEFLPRSACTGVRPWFFVVSGGRRR